MSPEMIKKKKKKNKKKKKKKKRNHKLETSYLLIGLARRAIFYYIKLGQN